ncbi:MAG: hypothetical protein HUJ22_13335 [Gracilimonas sp.]|uniref:hypothetical protein n=1 Tax=Gracilimonas sp. TaxID=1974203 RepID=UPI0019B757C6|nr:hypothetical protein [Gracilimonas sp.]MBD3617542.1 hypothetical protein [Gracilimonas sp.]
MTHSIKTISSYTSPLLAGSPGSGMQGWEVDRRGNLPDTDIQACLVLGPWNI